MRQPEADLQQFAVTHAPQPDPRDDVPQAPTSPLFTPLVVGALSLSHRVVMAPLSRLRAREMDGSVTCQMVRYYARRATQGGLIVAEALAVSPQGVAQTGTPCMFDPAHANGWRAVTGAVHRRGGIIIAQLWHGGRLARAPDATRQIVSASAIRAKGLTYAPAPQAESAELPVELDEDGIDSIIDQYRQAAEFASDAGFDGVEMHCANGCLADQFLHDGSNHRSDDYGGSFEGRTRFLKDAVQTLSSVWGAERVGVRLSPFGLINDVHDSDTVHLFSHVLKCLQNEGVAYVHLMEARAGAGFASPRLAGSAPEIAQTFRSHFSRVIIASGNFDAARANAAIVDGSVDAVSFGRAFLSHPDLPSRLAAGGAIAAAKHEDYFPARVNRPAPDTATED